MPVQTRHHRRGRAVRGPAPPARRSRSAPSASPPPRTARPRGRGRRAASAVRGRPATVPRRRRAPARRGAARRASAPTRHATTDRSHEPHAVEAVLAQRPADSHAWSRWPPCGLRMISVVDERHQHQSRRRCRRAPAARCRTRCRPARTRPAAAASPPANASARSPEQDRGQADRRGRPSTARKAPALTARVSGEASMLREIDCMTAPAAPSAMPTTTPAATRGSRESTMTADACCRAAAGHPPPTGRRDPTVGGALHDVDGCERDDERRADRRPRATSHQGRPSARRRASGGQGRPRRRARRSSVMAERQVREVRSPGRS